MRFTWLPAVAIATLAGCAPPYIAHSTCRDHPLTTASEWTCTVSGSRVETRNDIRYSTTSRNQVAHVKVALQVTKGRLRLTFFDLTGQQHVLVTPSEPGELSFQVRLRSEDRSFTIRYEPVDGAVEGLTGTVEYSTP
jgi:hypothetical protein